MVTTGSIIPGVITILDEISNSCQKEERAKKSSFLIMTSKEMAERKWDYVDVVIVTGDAYVDHPSFAMAILGRILESEGYRVAILSQPKWNNCEDWKRFGNPRLFFGISAGNMDSMINHYTANRKVRNDDAYSPGGKIGLRPDRATLAYCQRAREAYPGVPVIAGGVEASLRRLAHYDYWSDTVKKSILLDSKADLVVYGMGERPILEIAKRLSQGEKIKSLRNMRGVAYALGASEIPPSEYEGKSVVTLPSFEKVSRDRFDFAEATKMIHTHTNPFNAATLIQFHDKQAVVINPPDLPLSQGQMDRIYDLPFIRKPHSSYQDSIPAFEMIKDSVTIMRGCFGGCTFCSITTHQGKIIQSRSEKSILKELASIGKNPKFSGVISDIGGPTANMYQMRCTRPDIEAKCRRQSCVDPTICKLLGTDHGPLVDLMKKSRKVPGIRKVFVASGVRMDLAQLSDEYMRELAAHHIGGLLKVAPEHTDKRVLSLMKKPSIKNFESFDEKFKKVTQEVGKPKQYLVPYFIASHPGSDLNAMIDLALFLKRNGYKPDQVQDFIPAPFDVATCMYHTGLDPFTKKEVFIAKHLRDRKLQRALLQFFKPENYFEVRKALEQAGRMDLIGEGCEALIPSQAPREALRERMEKANHKFKNEYVHHIPNQASSGYRPKRTSAHRREKNVKNFTQKKTPPNSQAEGRFF